MKNPSSLLTAIPAEENAQIVIQAIQNWVKQRYPSLASATQARVILECLIEVNEENRYLAAQ